jgi:hypothetical protein
VNSALPSSLLLLLFFLPFTWGRHRRARATTALPRATSLELLILFASGDGAKEIDKIKKIMLSLSNVRKVQYKPESNLSI